MSTVGHASLMQGWLPLTVYSASVVALICALGWRSRLRNLRWLPAIVVFAVLATALVRWYFGTLGSASEPAPWQLWLWVALSIIGVGSVLAGWSRASWSRRNLAAFATSLCLLSTGLAVNAWIGYVPTVATGWNQLTGAPLPGQTDWGGVAAAQRRTIVPRDGMLLPVRIDAPTSRFAHREELVYLPPAWFRSTPPPALPAVLMIGGAFNTPADWVRAGDAVHTLNAFAAAHGGNAPVVVFADSNGSFGNDTECVNGPRGNAADHLTKDVVPYLIATFGVRAEPSAWGVAGFSAGGTCAVTLAVKYPEIFSAFVDIAGDETPNAGTKANTIERLYGGNAEAWSQFDPVTVMARHGAYTATSGLFVVPQSGEEPDGYLTAARTLCNMGFGHGIDCSIVQFTGRHVWPFAARSFAETLPWLASRVGVPGAPAASIT